MAEGIPEGFAAAAANPHTSPQDLRMIAYQYPSLRAVVAANPSAYPGLLEWLGQLGDPYVDQALFRRSQRQNHTSAGAPAAVSAQQGQPASFAPRAQQLDGTGSQPGGFVSLQQYQAQASSENRHAGQAGQAGAESNSHNPLVIIAILVALILVLGVFTLFLMYGQDKPSTDPQTSSPGQTETTLESTPSPSPTSNPTQSTDSPSPSEEDLYPAPDGAFNAGSVQSPTGNIRCVLQGDTVMCSLVEHDFSASGFADCGEGVSITVGAGKEDAGLRCEQGLVQGGMVLQYGQTAVSGDVACSSFENGMSCWNTVTGKGFAINRAGWRSGNAGSIPAAEYGF